MFDKIFPCLSLVIYDFISEILHIFFKYFICSKKSYEGTAPEVFCKFMRGKKNTWGYLKKTCLENSSINNVSVAY